MAGKRRGRGEGSIYRRRDGRWVGQYVVSGKRRYVYGKTRREVAGKLNRAIAERDTGIYFDSRGLTLGEYLDSWLGTLHGTISPHTVRRHEELTRIHIKPVLGGVKLDKLAPLQVQSLYSHKLKEGLSPATVSRMHATLSKALRQASRWRLVSFNACTAVTPPRPIRPEIAALDAGQLKILLETAREEADLHALWVLMATTGLRVGEALGLQWSDIDLEARTLRVSRMVYRGEIGQPKTAAGRRTIRLSRLAVAALQQHPRNGSRWVFATSRGNPLNASNLRIRRWRPMLERGGLPAIRMHDLRHSAATLLLSRGTPVKVVSEMLGHADVKITLAIYAHVLPDMQDEAAAEMDRALG